MSTELLQKLETTLVARNPGIAALLQPGMPAEDLRKQLKRAGVVGDVEPIVAFYAWHDGMRGVSKEAQRLGFAPPTVSTPPPANVEYLAALGLKVDPNQKIYGSFIFINFESVIRSLKMWKKFCQTSKQYAALLGRCVPFMFYTQTGQELALDTDPAGHGRLISIQPDNMKTASFRAAYQSFAAFLEDAIRANEENRVMTWIAAPGEAIELPPSSAALAAKAKSAAKSKKNRIPVTENIFVLRTDFSDDAAWDSLRARFAPAGDELAPVLDFISDPAFGGLTAKQVAKLVPEEWGQGFAVIVDQMALTHAEHPVLVVDLQEEPGKSFRVIPAAFGGVYDNLSIANMDFAEFAEAVDKDGIFRGFQ